MWKRRKNADAHVVALNTYILYNANKGEKSQALEFAEFLPWKVSTDAGFSDALRNCTKDDIAELRQTIKLRRIKGLAKTAFLIACGER